MEKEPFVERLGVGEIGFYAGDGEFGVYFDGKSPKKEELPDFFGRDLSFVRDLPHDYEFVSALPYLLDFSERTPLAGEVYQAVRDLTGYRNPRNATDYDRETLTPALFEVLGDSGEYGDVKFRKTILNEVYRELVKGAATGGERCGYSREFLIRLTDAKTRTGPKTVVEFLGPERDGKGLRMFAEDLEDFYLLLEDTPPDSTFIFAASLLKGFITVEKDKFRDPFLRALYDLVEPEACNYLYATPLNYFAMASPEALTHVLVEGLKDKHASLREGYDFVDGAFRIPYGRGGGKGRAVEELVGSLRTVKGWLSDTATDNPFWAFVEDKRGMECLYGFLHNVVREYSRAEPGDALPVLEKLAPLVEEFWLNPDYNLDDNREMFRCFTDVYKNLRQAGCKGEARRLMQPYRRMVKRVLGGEFDRVRRERAEFMAKQLQDLNAASRPPKGP